MRAHVCIGCVLVFFSILCPSWVKAGLDERAEPYRLAPVRAYETIIVTEKDHGRQIHLQVQDVLVLRLEAIPAAGYGWQVKQNAEPQLEIIDHPIFEDSPTGLIGAPVRERFRFRAGMAGSGELELHYQQPWEKSAPPDRLFRLHIMVEADLRGF